MFNSLRKVARKTRTRFITDENANVLIISALALPVLVGAAGLAVDTVQWTLWKRELQRAADSAAIAGVMAITQSKDSQTAALRDLEIRKNRDFSSTPLIETPPTDGSFQNLANHVRVKLETSQALPFSSLFLRTPPKISASATAGVTAGADNCVLALSKSASKSIQFQGNSNIDIRCGISSNSSAADSIQINKPNLATDSITTVGGVKYGNSGSDQSVRNAYQNYVKTNTPFQLDPYKNISSRIPTCNKYETIKTGNTSNDPGCYTSVKLTGNNQLKLKPGTYVFNGDFDASSGSLIMDDPGKKGLTLIINGAVKITGKEIDLTASSSGDFSGVLVYATGGSPVSIGGNNQAELTGAIYAPNSDITYLGNAGIKSTCLQFIAQTVYFNGNGKIDNNCPINGNPQPFKGTIARLVE